MIGRRKFIGTSLGGIAVFALGETRALALALSQATGVVLSAPQAGEDVFGYVQRQRGSFEAQLYQQILGTANEFKEGDLIIGVSAADDASRRHARSLLANTLVSRIDAHPLREDDLHKLSMRAVDSAIAAKTAPWKLSELREFLLRATEAEIKAIMPGLSSDVIGCVVKLMTDADLIAVADQIVDLDGSHAGPGVTCQ